MSSLFDAIGGGQSADPYAEIQLPSNQPIDPNEGANKNDLLGRYLEQMRQRTANMQALGIRMSPFQTALNMYDQASGTALPPPNVVANRLAIQPVRSPDTSVDKPQPVQMPTPSPLLQSSGGLKKLFKMMASGG